MPPWCLYYADRKIASRNIAPRRLTPNEFFPGIGLVIGLGLVLGQSSGGQSYNI